MEGPPNVSLVSSGELELNGPVAAAVQFADPPPHLHQQNQQQIEMFPRMLKLTGHSLLDRDFWPNFSHEAYADIRLVFKDGALAVNRAGLAVLSAALATA